MTVERFVLTALWVISLSVCPAIPKRKRREAWIALLACQAMTWVSTMLHVWFGLLKFPVREFPKATDLNFTTEFFFYPFLCALYVISEPKGSGWVRFGHLAVWLTVVSVIDQAIVSFTDLIRYEHYAWYWTWITFGLLFAVTNAYVRMFFRPAALQSERRSPP
ncbi:CBO0543 family protein [Paenibacillus flagellatus]|uniref:CBO0543 family protein n=1 Tax=Paenibacillus flagellatus TaxID=2211139 RepID=UPI0011B4CF8C|nr:CBO0543 family protein [Paenibacillus flagellatus]